MPSLCYLFLDEGDTRGCKKKLPEKVPKKGKKETPEGYALRLERLVQDELLKASRTKKDKVCNLLLLYFVN